jgi:hypothetical protein
MNAPDNQPGRDFASLTAKVDVVHFPREVQMYSVTNAEIDNYASFGWQSTLALAFAGLAGGFSLGCLTSLLQGAGGSEVVLMLRACMWLSAVVAVVFLGFALWQIGSQRRMRKDWERHTFKATFTPQAPHGSQ